MRQALILAGGAATRMLGYEAGRPKLLFEVDGRTLLERYFLILEKHGISEVLLLLRENSSQIQEFLMQLEYRKNIQVKVILESIPLGTGGAILNALDFCDDSFLVLHGDLFIDTDLNQLIIAGLSESRDFAQLIHSTNHLEDSDLVILESGTSRIKGYSLKPRYDLHKYRNLANAGIYTFKKSCFDKIPLQCLDLDRELLPSLLKQGKIGQGVRNLGFVRDVGTPSRLFQVRNMINTNHGLIKEKLVIFDRDGTLNVDIGHLRSYEEIRLFEDTAKCVNWFNENGYFVAVATNQPVVARGMANLRDIDEIHNYMDYLLSREGAYIDEYYFCPHHPDSGYPEERKEFKIDCACRKPKSGMLLKAMKEFRVQPQNTIMIGDSWRDKESAEELGIPFFQVNYQDERNNFYSITDLIKELK